MIHHGITVAVGHVVESIFTGYITEVYGQIKLLSANEVVRRDV